MGDSLRALASSIMQPQLNNALCVQRQILVETLRPGLRVHSTWSPACQGNVTLVITGMNLLHPSGVAMVVGCRQSVVGVVIDSGNVWLCHSRARLRLLVHVEQPQGSSLLCTLIM